MHNTKTMQKHSVFKVLVPFCSSMSDASDYEIYGVSPGVLVTIYVCILIVLSFILYTLCFKFVYKIYIIKFISLKISLIMLFFSLRSTC